MKKLFINPIKATSFHPYLEREQGERGKRERQRQDWQPSLHVDSGFQQPSRVLTEKPCCTTGSVPVKEEARSGDSESLCSQRACSRTCDREVGSWLSRRDAGKAAGVGLAESQGPGPSLSHHRGRQQEVTQNSALCLLSKYCSG